MQISYMMHEENTRKTASRAARAVMSAQETTLPHCLWTRARRSLMILKDRALRLKFGGASFSLGPLADPSNNTEPSQPYISSRCLIYLQYIFLIN